MPDKYTSFAHLCEHEQENVDFSVKYRSGQKDVLILAPHGGKIEIGTSEIAEALSSFGYHLYCFEGIKIRNNKDLHITSTRFDEPRCLSLLDQFNVVISIHGLRSDSKFVHVGGLDGTLRNNVAHSLVGADFDTKCVTNGAHAAISPKNICNLGRSKAGVQLEITKGLRNFLLENELFLLRFCRAIHEVVELR